MTRKRSRRWTVVALGVVSLDRNLGGLHLGNALFAADAGATGIYAPDVAAIAQLPIVVHDFKASLQAHPYLDFAPAAAAHIKIAGGDLGQPNGSDILVTGVTQVQMGAGQSSNGVTAPALTCQGHLVDDAGTSVTSALVTGP